MVSNPQSVANQGEVKKWSEIRGEACCSYQNARETLVRGGKHKISMKNTSRISQHLERYSREMEPYKTRTYYIINDNRPWRFPPIDFCRLFALHLRIKQRVTRRALAAHDTHEQKGREWCEAVTFWGPYLVYAVDKKNRHPVTAPTFRLCLSWASKTVSTIRISVPFGCPDRRGGFLYGIGVNVASDRELGAFGLWSGEK